MSLDLGRSAFGKAPWSGSGAVTRGVSGGYGVNSPNGGAAQSSYWTNPYGSQIPDSIQSGIAQNPQYTYYQGQNQRLGAKSDFLGSYYDTQRAGQQSDYNTSLGQLGVQRQSNALDAGQAARDAAYYQAMKVNAGQQRDNQIAGLQGELATTGRGINSQSTAAGNWFAPGRGDAIADAYTKFGNEKSNADLQYQQQAGLYDRRADDARTRATKLDLMGKSFGMDADKLKNNLTQGLANLGYSQFMSQDQLLDALDSNNAQQQQMAQQILQQAVQSGNVYHSGQLGDYYENYTRPGQLNADRNGR